VALTQMALDSLDFDATVALAEKVAPHVDILEIGTPCIKHNGIKLLETLRAKFPNNKILVDLKTMDAGFYEAEPFYKAGADICTVLGVADLGTIKGVIDAANKYGKKAQIDLINVADKAARTQEVAKLGAHIIGVHTGLDQQAAGQTPFADLATITGLNLGLDVSVAGGVKAATVDGSASDDDGSTSVLDLLDGSSLNAASNGNIQTQVQAGDGCQVSERSLTSSLLVQTGVNADDVRAQLGNFLSTSSLVSNVDQVDLCLLAVLVGSIDHTLDGAQVSNAQNCTDVSTGLVERLSFVEASVHGLQVNQDLVVWELGTQSFQQLDTVVLDAWGTNFQDVNVRSNLLSQSNGCVKIQ